MSETANAGYRVSPLQRHRWARRLDGREQPYAQLGVRLEGPVDAERLAAATAAVVARHESLRTSFVGLAGRAAPLQVVGEPGPSPLRVVEAPDATVEALCRDERAGLDPVDGPTFRAVLTRVAPDRALFVLTAHALVGDRGSLRTVLAEIAAAYRGDAASSELPMQYADFAAWHDELLTGEDGAAERAAWAGQLTAELFEPVLGLARRADGAASAASAASAGSADGAGGWRTHRTEVDAELTRRVAEFAAAASGTPADVLAALFEVLVWRFCGERDVLVAEVAPGRSYDSLRGAVGAFEREVPVACRLSADTPFRELVAESARRRAEWVDRVDHLDPEKVVDHAGKPAAPFFAFHFANASESLVADQVTFVPVLEAATSDAAFRLTCTERDNRLVVEIGYDEERVDPAQPERVAECFAVLLRNAMANPATPVGEIDMLSDAERERVVALSRGPVVDSPVVPVHQAFAAQARRTPDAVAVVADGVEITYAALDARAGRLAQRLVQLGVRQGDPVVISVGRSVELLVGVLGVLKAGAAFVPVDVAYPLRRLEFVLEETAAPVLLGTSELRDRLGECRAILLALDEDEDGDEPVVGKESTVDAESTDLAYVMYTSGTTGSPNGVRVTHGGLANYLHWAADAYQLREGTGAVVHSSISFDLTLTALLAPLLVGQRVVLLSETAGVTGLVATLRTSRDLSLVKLTPTHLDVVNQLLEPEQVAGSVRTLVVGGEALHARSVAPFRAAGTRIVNEYGPTETVVGSVAHVVDESTPHAGPVPIGVPIANTQAYLLDPRRQPVADGVVGEVYLGGAGVALGYLNRPELTEQRFLPNPFGDGRLYRTGDLARRRADGTLEYLGRADEQVKIRGVRIEPAEIENVLLRHGSVGQVAVVARRDEDPGRSSPLVAELTLVAYVVPADQAAAPGVADLAEHCRAHLPEHLVPAAFVVMDALPVTANGKLDRAALPRPAGHTPVVADYVPPRTGTEEILAAAIATVLGVSRVGIDDNYFALGGDSIRSVMIASRAQASGVEVSVADLHRLPTVRQCAAHLDAREEPVEPPRTEPFALVREEDRPLIPAEVEDAFPLNLLQEGMIFHRDFAAKSAVYHAIASVRLRAPFDLDVMRMVVRQLLERHPMLRTSFDMGTFSQPLQLVHTEYETPLYHEDLRGLPAEEQDSRVEAWIEHEKERGFELHEYPLIRFMVHRIADDVFQFTYGFHHEIVDGWSEALMIAELFSHYFSVVYDEPIAIRPPTSTMRDAVALELEALEDRRNYEFWDSYLADATLMRLPRLGSGPRADKGDREIVRIAVPVSVELSDRLKELALANAVPLKTVLMAAHMAVMSTYGGHTDTLTYTVTNGRPETADGSTAIGLFVNSLALRVRMAGGTWRDLILATLESERASLPYRRLPMAELKRHQGNEPLAEALFFFTNYHVFGVLDRWKDRGVEHVANELYGESTFPFCGIFRLNRETGHLEVRMEYDSLQFSAELMDSIRDCYARVMETMVADPRGRYDTRAFLSDRDRELLASYVSGPTAHHDDLCLHELIEDRASERPDAVAVQLDDAVLTYRELNRGANRLAHVLRRHGVGPEWTVGVLAERSVEQIVSLLAVLKAGGAYLPLDPSQPDERINALVRASGVTVVLAQEHLVSRVPAGPTTIGVNPSAGTGEDAPDTNPVSGVVPANPAYVMFTSGSTGQPKGVVVEHRNVVASLAARAAAYEGEVERFLLLSSFAFDSSVAGIFWTLTQGGTLVLPREGQQMEPAGLVETIARQRPTHTLGIPSLLAPVVEQANPGELSSLRLVVAAGEPCPTALARACATAVPECVLANEYGPTEATVWATMWSAAEAPDRPQLPIGSPVANTRVEVLNPHGLPVPIGVSGELHLGGAGVARGYLGRPAETAASFRPDPASPGRRRYASGDLGRYLADGELEFLGRADHQVKVRGFRVEPGEVEAVLETHPDLQRVIVVARGENAADKVLVAYVLPVPGQRPDPADLQQYVRDRLPKYMVPSACVVLDAVPLTATGKVDRASLPEPTRAELTGGRGYQPPRTETEQALAAIWADVLKLDRVGIADRFFDLGGESLRAMQVTAATNRMFGIKLSVRRLFDAPTIAEFALGVDEARLAREGAGAATGDGAGRA
uniref:TlmX n=1 Tax=Streptoalloteichus hindustanus TaxID=2017 RepID=A4KUA8_STRHI|nr:TlmX [Streptoalloteichus hindustanus]